MNCYINPDKNALITAVLVPDVERAISTDPLVQINEKIELTILNKQLPFELARSEIASDSYLVKVNNVSAWNIISLTEILKEHLLIDDQFQSYIIESETKRYHERMANKKGRRVYEYPQSSESLIQAFFIQEHFGQSPFIRFKKEKTQELNEACDRVGLSYDPTSTVFETTAILGYKDNISHKDLTVTEALKRLEKAKIITHDFRYSVLAAENLISQTKTNETSYSDATIKKIQERLHTLEDLVNEHTRCAKVKHGLFSGQPARPLREIASELNRVKDNPDYINEGISNIINIARTMGKQHPIFTCAVKINALLLPDGNKKIFSEFEFLRRNSLTI